MSDKTTAAPGPAMKLAKSTTFRPAKMLSLGIRKSFLVGSFSLKLWLAFFEKRLCAFLLVICAGAKAEQRRFQCQALSEACFHSFVNRFERILHSHWSIREDLINHCFG